MTNKPQVGQNRMPTNSSAPATDSQSVLAMLRRLSQNPDNPSVRHMICVGDTAATIAAALKAKGHQLDVNKVRTLGYLHDVGRLIGPAREHTVNGYFFLKEQGFPEEYCNISLTHSYPRNDCRCVLSTPPDPAYDQVVIDFLPHHTYTLSEQIVVLCDLMCKYRPMTTDQRIVDVLSRHGTWEGTQACILAVRQLKADIDQLLGHNVYDLFPEIKENL